jgi:hypothetical protein
MDDFTKLSWWIAFLGAGLIWTIIRAYVWPPINKALSSVSGKWRAYSDANKAKNAQFVAELRADNHKQLLLLAQETHLRLISITSLLFSILLLVIYLITTGKPSETIALNPWLTDVAYWTSIGTLFWFLVMHKAAMRCRSIMREALYGDSRRIGPPWS